MVLAKSIRLDSFTTSSWDPDRIWSYCKKCNLYDVHFSCPEHTFHIPNYLSDYQYVWVFVQTITDHRSFGNSTDQRFFHYRDCLDPTIMKEDSEKAGLQALLPGQCRNCTKHCQHELYDECRYPNLLRYSFESLGFDVEKILDIYFDKKLTFTDGEHILVYGYLAKTPMPTEFLESMTRKALRCETE